MSKVRLNTIKVYLRAATKQELEEFAHQLMNEIANRELHPVHAISRTGCDLTYIPNAYHMNAKKAA